MKKNWIKGAIKHPGALTRLAKSKGMSTAKFCSGEVKGHAASMCALRKTLMGFHK